MRLIISTLITLLPAFIPATLAAEHTQDSLEVVQKKIAAGKAVLVDVREQDEWNKAHVKGAVLVSLSALRDPVKRKAVVSKLPRDKRLYCHCGSGQRSLLASDALKQLGYDAEALKPGIQELLEAGFPKAKLEPTVTFLYGDRASADGINGLKRAWGMTTVTRIGGKTIMFNTGADDEALITNMKVLRIRASDIDIVVLSHRHWEMWESTGVILRDNPDVAVYAPSDLMPEIKKRHPDWLKQIRTLDHEVKEIMPGVLLLKTHSKPRRGGPNGVEELHLIVRTEEGITIGQGCGHTGIFEIAQRASAITRQRPYLIYGGTRLTETPTKVARPGYENGFTVPPARHATTEYIKKLGNDLRSFGVRKLIATHCTGSKSEAILKEKFGDDFVSERLGMTITLPPLETKNSGQ